MLTVVANLLTFVMLMGFVWQRYKTNRSWIDPGIVFAINLVLLYPIRGFVIFFLGDDALPDFPGIEIPENLMVTSWYAVLGTAGYIVGFLLVAGRKPMKIIQVGKIVTNEYAIWVCFVYFAFAVMGVVYKIATGDYISFLMGENRIAGLTQIAHLLSTMQWPAFIGVWALFFSGARSKGFWLLFVLVNALVVPYQFIQGSKTFLSLTIFFIVLAYYWVKKIMPKFLFLVSVFLVAYFVFPYVHAFREYVNLVYGKIPSLSEFKLPTSELIPDHEEKKAEGFLALSARFGGMDHLYGITTTVPSILDYKYGRDYFAFIVNLVPRAIWADKPIFSRGADYGAALGTITSVTPFPYGEAYWDMGVFGLFFMMAVWGSCLALMVKIYDFFYKKKKLEFFVGLYFLSQIYWISSSESSMPMILAGLPQQVVMLFVIYSSLQLLTKKIQKSGLVHAC